MFLVPPGNKSFGSVVFPEGAADSLSLGRERASDGLVRQFVINAPMPVVKGTATPIGAWYSVVNYHYFKGLVDNNVPFSLQIGIGPGHAERSQLVNVSGWQQIPGYDMVLLTHAQPITNAPPVRFGTMNPGDVGLFTGFGDYATFGDTAFQRDAQARAWDMRLYDRSDPANWGFDFGVSNALRGGPGILDSSSPGYNTKGELVGILSTGLVELNGSDALGGMIPFESTAGLGDWIIAHTPLNGSEPWRVADANGDGRVSISDLGIFSGHFNQRIAGGRSVGDFNGDGSVTVGDLGLIATFFGQPNARAAALTFPDALKTYPNLPETSAVPEPSSAGILLVTFAALVQTRKR